MSLVACTGHGMVDDMGVLGNKLAAPAESEGSRGTRTGFGHLLSETPLKPSSF
ncbi:hypothetical protein PSET11_01877 [Arthrobacter ulcerisalmonis]|uniref:Uncharacterized protein n=1 Tax=Arthrobacter ulcerisalmonis TaxID=2483813 RepID=A0A3P5XEH3_9MICC|nr:hypothetical protein PSET11_01877 [Arthrobacter ulcerisalmonis]